MHNCMEYLVQNGEVSDMLIRAIFPRDHACHRETGLFQYMEHLHTTTIVHGIK